MGLSPFHFSDDLTTNPNPNPKNFKILKSYSEGDNVLLMVKYPNCTNYEGKKVMLYVNVSLSEIIAMKELDPHFFDKKFSPFARFKPTDKGWNAAIKLMGML